MLALSIGLSLGLVGSGGSILTVPVLVYVVGVDPELATAYSLFVVGLTALVGGVQNALHKQVDFKTALLFGAPSILAVYLTRSFIMPAIPKTLFMLGNFEVSKNLGLMLLFAVLMVLASFSMINSSKSKKSPPASPEKGPLDAGRQLDAQDELPIRYNYPLILMEGAGVGILTGLVGAGGGFLIIPALVLLARLPMRLAVGTSLLIIAAKSLIGFVGDLQSRAGQIDWPFLLLFSGFSIAGIFAGTLLSKKIPGPALKQGFGWFVLAMGIYIIIKELVFPH